MINIVKHELNTLTVDVLCSYRKINVILDYLIRKEKKKKSESYQSKVKFSSRWYTPHVLFLDQSKTLRNITRITISTDPTINKFSIKLKTKIIIHFNSIFFSSPYFLFQNLLSEFYLFFFKKLMLKYFKKYMIYMLELFSPISHSLEYNFSLIFNKK